MIEATMTAGGVSESASGSRAASSHADAGIRRRMAFAALLEPGEIRQSSSPARTPLPLNGLTIIERPAPPRSRGGSSPPLPPGPSPPPPPGFERSLDTRSPHLIRFRSVPDWARHPLGPYRQAPEEYGGDWWQVNPFTGPEPWRALDPPEPVEDLPEGFERVFGPRPKRGDFANAREHRIARIEWEQEQKYFRGIGIPEGADEAALAEARQQFSAWGLGEPVFFQDRYGWRVRFPDSQIPNFGGSPNTAVTAPHILIANYQIQLLEQGITPERLHPWLPDQLRPELEAS
jgi:hypothetical protein